MSYSYHPKAVNHLVTFCDGSQRWEKMSEREKAFYEKRELLLSQYVESLLDNNMGVC